MITLTAQAAYGKTGQYVARIVGRHPSYTFERQFVGRKTGKRHETTEADLDSPGLYEICDVKASGKQQRYVLVLDVGHRLVAVDCDKREAMQIGRALDDGLVFTQFVRATADGTGYEILAPSRAKAEQRRADVARTVQTAADECWGILQALPTREAKRVVASLRKKLSAPEATPEVAPASQGTD